LAGIKKLAPTHCTGAAAIELMRKEFKDDLIEVVEGMTFEV
jgi:metal-dependent hydrolase (beta-lactamase superfamily II)